MHVLGKSLSYYLTLNIPLEVKCYKLKPKLTRKLTPLIFLFLLSSTKFKNTLKVILVL